MPPTTPSEDKADRSAKLPTPNQRPTVKFDPETKQRTHWDHAWSRFRRDRFAIGGGLMVLVLIIVAIGAPWIAPHDPLTQFPDGLTGDFGVPVAPGTSRFLLGTDALGRDFRILK